MTQSDWKRMAAARGLRLSEPDLAKLAAAMEAIQPAYQALVEGLTHETEPVTTLGEEAVEVR
jgi:hypothetical protein